MRVEKLNLQETGQFSPLFLDYLFGKDALRQFYDCLPQADSFGQEIEKRHLSPELREQLFEVLTRQYQNLSASPTLKANLELLKEQNTFTVTTGHQLNIFTGPLYFIYKIVTTINLARQLKARFPESNFVPVYWMASEDHDFEEINSFRLFGKKFTWEAGSKGPVGRLDPTTIPDIVQDVDADIEVFKQAYQNQNRLSDAVRDYVNALFGEEGLVVIDADNRSLKSAFKRVIGDDIFNQTANDLVENANQKLQEIGYKTQVFPRSINFFYMEDDLRGRIVQEEGKFKVLDTDMVFDREEMEHQIDEAPEKFSPNVVLRPLYQETILPNVAYIGGPAEVAYWLQLKSVFDHYQVAFPVVMPRNFALLFHKSAWKKFEKTSLTFEDIFLDKHEMINKLAKEGTKHNIQLNGERDAIIEVFRKIKVQAEEIDPTLGPFVAAQAKQTENHLEAIEKKFLKAEKRIQSERLNQAEALKDRLFPGGGLQERTDNFLNFYLTNPNLLKELIGSMDPFDFRFHLLIEED